MDSAGSVAFGSPTYLHSSVSVFFPDQVSVDGIAKELHEAVSPQYQPPERVAVPDEASPEVPRLLFRSQHGFSQIAVSRTSVVLTVQYSPAWQRDIQRGETYLVERLPLLKKMIRVLESTVAFVGLATTVQFPTEDDGPLVAALARNHSGPIDIDHPHDINLRLTSIVDDKFFRNLAISNYRSWAVPAYNRGLIRLSTENQSDRGLELSIDFNNRFAYNESADYMSSEDTADKVLRLGFSELRRLVEEVSEGKWL